MERKTLHANLKDNVFLFNWEILKVAKSKKKKHIQTKERGGKKTCPCQENCLQSQALATLVLQYLFKNVCQEMTSSGKNSNSLQSKQWACL